MKNGFLKITMFIVFMAAFLASCSKEEEQGKQMDEKQIQRMGHTMGKTTGAGVAASEIGNMDKTSTVALPSGWSEITSKSKKGCKLYQKGGYYLQEIDLSQNAQIKLRCDAVLINNNYQPIGTAVASPPPGDASPWVVAKTVADWWNANSTVTRLWSCTNATFFGYPNADVAKSSLPVKVSGTIMTCGMGSNPTNQPKRVFYINWNSGTNQQVAGVSTINLGNPSGSGSASYYPYSTVNTALSGYTTAIVGFDPLTTYGNSCPVTGKNGRTYVGVNGSKVYFFVANFNAANNTECLNGTGATQQTAHNELVNWGCSTSNIVMFDGSGSSQINCLSSNYATGDNRKVASIFYSTYGQ